MHHPIRPLTGALIQLMMNLGMIYNKDKDGFYDQIQFYPYWLNQVNQFDFIQTSKNIIMQLIKKGANPELKEPGHCYIASQLELELEEYSSKSLMKHFFDNRLLVDFDIHPEVKEKITDIFNGMNNISQKHTMKF